MNFKSIQYETNDRVATITLNRPDSLNAIDQFMPGEIEEAVNLANEDDGIHAIILTGAGRGFCSGYDLKQYAEASGEQPGSQLGADQGGPWDPMRDYFFMKKNTEQFMSLWRSYKPTIAKVNGPAVAGGSDIALCCDLIIMADDAVIGYPPARVWGCPTTAMWVYRLGAQMAKVGHDLPELLKELNVNIGEREWRVISILGAYGGLTNSNVANLLQADVATISRAVKILKSLHYVDTLNSRKDKRKLLIFLTKSGAELYDKITPKRIETGDMIDSLTLRYNRARQAAITSELIEIISGAEAL